MCKERILIGKTIARQPCIVQSTFLKEVVRTHLFCTPGITEESSQVPLASSPPNSGSKTPVITPAVTIPTHGRPPGSYANTEARAVIQRNQSGQARSKRINSIVEDDKAFEDTDDEVWEHSAEEKRREKLRKRVKEKKLHEERQRKLQEERKRPKFIVGTGAKLDSKDQDCPGQAAPKHVFVARTAMCTTKETVEGCLEYLAGIKGVATCCTPHERIDSGEAFSLSWRVQVDSTDLEKALLPSSWKTGWAVKPYFFRRKRPDSRQQDQRADTLAQLFAQAGHGGPLRQNNRP